jgi:hypothetical protein
VHSTAHPNISIPSQANAKKANRGTWFACKPPKKMKSCMGNFQISINI